MGSDSTDMLTDRYKRWRHSRGFGVHSPFAYALVRNALHPSAGYAYYAEFDPRMKSCSRIPVHAQLLMHIIIFLRCNLSSANPFPQKTFSVAFIGRDIPEPYRFAIKAAGASLRKISPTGSPDNDRESRNRINLDADLIIISGNQGIANDLKSNQSLLILKESHRQDYPLPVMENGLIVDASRYILAINRPEMALTHLLI